MLIKELLTEEEKGWLSKTWDTVVSGFGDDFDLYVKEAEKVLNRLGSQGTIRHLQKKFPDADLIDLRRAVKSII